MYTHFACFTSIDTIMETSPWFLTHSAWRKQGCVGWGCTDWFLQASIFIYVPFSAFLGRSCVHSVAMLVSKMTVYKTVSSVFCILQ